MAIPTNHKDVDIINRHRARPPRVKVQPSFLHSLPHRHSRLWHGELAAGHLLQTPHHCQA